jgi:cytochrome b
MSDTTESGRLHVLKAIEDGWEGFTKAPMTFVLFTLLSGALGLIFQVMSHGAAIRSSAGSGFNPGTVLLMIVAVIGSTVISLWAVTGLIRGAWKALSGHKPSFNDFTRWDGQAAGRLFINQLVLAIALAIILVIAVAIGTGLFQVNQVLAVIPGLVAGIVFLYLGVNQKFLPFIATVEEGNPLDKIQRGRDVVDPSWWWMLLLLIVEVVILGIGLLLNGVGLLVASPLVICISTAAYRQLFGTADQTGFLSEH